MTIKYQTGRDYGTPQVLEINLPALPADELADVAVTFTDTARGIAGVVTLMAMEANPREIGRAVLREYDAGRYALSELAAEC